ncbi:MAG: VTT domain-containing protein [Acidobacteria bacterium]|nr:VTT domain-containing protein [Acidobacteriota bacterium]
MPIALEFFVHYAYGILFLWVLVEQLGVPVPSVPMLITAGTLTATHRIHAVPVMGAILLACAIADSMWYFAGVRYGGRVVRLICRLSLEASTCVRKTEGYFSRNGGWTLLFAKFVPGLSALAPPIAGQAGMSYPRFLLLDLFGSLIWASAFVFGGRFFGDIAQKSQWFFHALVHYGFVLFALLVVGIILYRMWRQRAFLRSVMEMRISNTELMQMITDAEKNHTLAPFIVDLRHPLDYLPDPRVLPGAVRIGPKEISKQADVLPRDRDIVLYCTCPSEETSAATAKQLHKLGIYRVRPLKGGFEAWRDAGLPLVEYDDSVPQSSVA